MSARVAVNPMAPGDGRRQRLGYAEDEGDVLPIGL